MPYPQWSYFPRNVRPPAWAIAFVEVVENAEAKVSTVAEKTGLSSDAVLSELRSGLLGLGYVVESGKTKAATIHRPVLFGENGKAEVNYEIDAFHDERGYSFLSTGSCSSGIKRTVSSQCAAATVLAMQAALARRSSS